MAISTVGIKLFYQIIEKDYVTSSNSKIVQDYTELTGIQGISGLASQPQEIDCTTLSDTSTKSIPGIQQAGAIQLTCVLETNQGGNFDIARLLEYQYSEESLYQVKWKILFPDTTQFEFIATAKTSLQDIGQNALATFALSLYRKSEIMVALPVADTVTITGPTETLFCAPGDFVQFTVALSPADAKITATNLTGAEVLISGKLITVLMDSTTTGTKEITLTATANTKTATVVV